MEKEQDIEVVKSVFFDAKSCGWSADAEKIDSIEFPDSKIIPFFIGDFKVIDCYLVNSDSDISNGTTTIWLKDKPVWVMNYGGWYKKQAIPFLKSCLQKAYTHERRFLWRSRSRICERPTIHICESNREKRLQ